MNWRVVAVPTASALLGLAVGWALARWWAPRAAYGLAGGLGVAAVLLILAARTAQGMEGLGWAILAILMLAPAGLGSALGGLLVRHQRLTGKG